jgi:hypothetical protein
MVVADLILVSQPTPASQVVLHGLVLLLVPVYDQLSLLLQHLRRQWQTCLDYIESPRLEESQNRSQTHLPVPKGANTHMTSLDQRVDSRQFQQAQFERGSRRERQVFALCDMRNQQLHQFAGQLRLVLN